MANGNGCDVCRDPGTFAYRLDQVEKDNRALESCMNGYKQDIQTIKTDQALIKQQLKNLMWPILIMLGAVLVEVGKTLLGLIKSGVPVA